MLGDFEISFTGNYLKDDGDLFAALVQLMINNRHKIDKFTVVDIAACINDPKRLGYDPRGQEVR